MGHWLQAWIVRGLRRASVVIPVSTATAADVERIVGGPTGKRSVILNALNYPYRKISREEALGRLSQAGQLEIANPFVLHVGQNHPRKNRPGVIRAFAQACRKANLQLVLVGPPLDPPLQELIRAEGIANRVTVIVEPSNGLLEALYNLALALFFPSRYEGFGWPLIEAQACGCPVICSRCAPFAEVVGSSAIIRDVDDERGFAEDILRLARDASEREAWIANGLQNAARFDPKDMIARYVNVYRQLAKRP
jgi:glycosyltransferase involved in cell wall biosynthesis